RQRQPERVPFAARPKSRLSGLSNPIAATRLEPTRRGRTRPLAEGPCCALTQIPRLVRSTLAPAASIPSPDTSNLPANPSSFTAPLNRFRAIFILARDGQGFIDSLE